MALASHRLGIHDEAVIYGEVALKAAPHIERLAKNLGFYIAARGERKSDESTSESS